MATQRLVVPIPLIVLTSILLTICVFLLGPSSVNAQTFPPVFSSRVVSMAVAPETPPSIYALVAVSQPWVQASHPWYGLYRSRDDGHGWEQMDLRGIGEITEASSLAVDYRDPGVLYLAASVEPFPYGALSTYRLSTGSGWEKLSGPVPGFAALAVDLKDGNVIYAGERYGDLGGFVRSNDGGRTWKPFDVARPDPLSPLPGGLWRAPVRQILVDPVDPEVLYASMVWDYRYRESRLFRGDRNGNWVQMSTPRPTDGILSVEGIAFDPRTRSLYLGSGPWGGGGTVSVSARKLWRSDNAYAADPSRVTWTEVASFDLGRWGWQAPLPSVAPLAVDASRDTTLYVQTHAADAALWRSTDVGMAWEALRIPQPLYSAPGTSADFSWTSGATGHTVSGEWLGFLKAHGDTDNLGYPRTEVIADPMAAGQTVQYFQRLILEWHPENPPEYRIQRRLLGDVIYPGADPPLDPDDPGMSPPGDSHYFPNQPGLGLGHYVADYAPDGSFTYFREYFDSHGGVEAFGYPKEEPRLRNGQWTQRFQAAVFEYHPENDVEGTVPGTDIPLRNYRVELELLGDRFVEANRLTYR